MTENSQDAAAFLDSSQYQTELILQYESVYGEDFVSPGGLEMARELIARMNLAPGARVLDVGCGLGGSAFVMASEFDLKVDGIDLSNNMLEIARRKLEQKGLADQVAFEWGDCLELDQESVYDAVYSRDVFLHIHDKSRLFEVLRRALRSGGQLLFTDYCCGPQPWGDDFSAYVEERGYDLHTPEAYRELIVSAGFQQAAGQDISDRFIEILEADIRCIDALDVDPRQREYLATSWRQKLARSRSGDHRWGLFTAIR